MLLGLFLGGAIDYFVPDGFVIRFLGQRRKMTLIYAVVAGFLMTACSHGILVTAARRIRRISCRWLERVKGIEPSFSAWEADVLPLNYTRE